MSHIYFQILFRDFFILHFLGRGISMDEFVQMSKEDYFNKFNVEMPAEDVEMTKLRFRNIDTDKSGQIDWY